MPRDSVVRTLYRFQQRIGMTPAEFRAVMLFTALLLTGSVAEHVRNRLNRPDPAVYAATEAYFRERAALRTTLSESAERLPEPARGPGERLGPGVGDSSEGDPGPVVSQEAPSPSSAETVSGGRVDINTADRSSLQQLPGIGPALADRIVSFRSRSGPFVYVEDLLMVRGIGERTLHRLAPLIRVDGLPDSANETAGQTP